MTFNNEASIKKEIEDSMKRRHQWEHTEGMLNLIYDKLIPLYRNTPYWTSGVLHQLRKLYFIEYCYQASDMVKYDVNMHELMFASVASDLSLVFEEFNPKLRVPNKGMKSAAILESKFKDLLEYCFGYKPWDDTTAITKALKEYEHVNSIKSAYRYRYYSELDKVLNDVENLADFFTIGLSGRIRELMHDHMYLAGLEMKDPNDSDNEIQNMYYRKTLIELNILYGKSGVYKIKSKALAESPFIMNRFNSIKDAIHENCKEN